MSKILFFATNRVHKARQKLLIQELGSLLSVVEIEEMDGPIADNTLLYAREFRNALTVYQPELLLIRGDRYEMLPAAMLAAYQGIPVAHIEGGDMSGMIDNKVRHAITQLAEYHFVTNEQSMLKVIAMTGMEKDVYNYGSLDAEYAALMRDLPDPIGVPYALILYHPLSTEPDVFPWIEEPLDGMRKVYIRSNKDQGQIAGDEYDSDTYLALLNHATILIGNSSSFLKEASVYGTPVVNIGDRQGGRLKAKSVQNADCTKESIIKAIKFQLQHGKYFPESPYHQPDSAKKIAERLRQILSISK